MTREQKEEAIAMIEEQENSEHETLLGFINAVQERRTRLGKLSDTEIDEAYEQLFD